MTDQIKKSNNFLCYSNDGLIDGSDDGLFVGIALGSSVISLDGCIEGIEDGVYVGIFEGI